MYRLEIIRDVMPESPREFHNLGTMVCWHQRYVLGDHQPKESPEEFIESIPEDSVLIPLYLYDHSGVTMSTRPFSCPWDSGQVGYIYVAPDVIKSEYGNINDKTRDKAREVLEAEVRVYDEWLRGECWGFELYNGDDLEDSCWGFLGDELDRTGIDSYLGDDFKHILSEAWENRR